MIYHEIIKLISLCASVKMLRPDDYILHKLWYLLDQMTQVTQQSIN